MSTFTLALTSIVGRVFEGASLVGHRPLSGGVSAQISAVECRLPDGDLVEVVLRQEGGADWKELGADTVAVEFALHKALVNAQLRVPEPLLLDVSGKTLDGPFMVMTLLPGNTEVAQGGELAAATQMADFLIALHALDAQAMDVDRLPQREDPIAGALEYLPDTDDLAELRALIGDWQMTLVHDSVLHGDFWPGNVLWNNGQLSGVIDWEDAAVGSALSDIACTRAELAVAYGEAAVVQFTQRYLEQSELVPTDLPLWGIYVSSAALATMEHWGLPKEQEQARRAATQRFLDESIKEFFVCARGY